ncbi:DUF805 domain-containing protein [Luteibacter sp.]|jgi:uncharacterized membrane protein YhaH (DUF805 family)|uniref:DUF805 domain-containing protein n=1 Tax=Luteibacter sp. TaxID=1886636 RepID=UPI002F42545D
MNRILKKHGEFLSLCGRARRTEYWTTVVLATVTEFVIGVFAYLADARGSAYELIVGLCQLLGCVACIPVTVRRLHDVDWRGWWYLVPFVSLILIFLDGTRGPNRFGPSPKYFEGKMEERRGRLLNEAILATEILVGRPVRLWAAGLLNILSGSIAIPGVFMLAFSAEVSASLRPELSVWLLGGVASSLLIMTSAVALISASDKLCTMTVSAMVFYGLLTAAIFELTLAAEVGKEMPLVVTMLSCGLMVLLNVTATLESRREAQISM